MIDIQALRDQATALRKEKKYEDARVIFQQLWEETNDKWDGWGLALCCNQVKDYDTAYEMCHSVLEIDPDFQYIKQQLTRAVLQKIKDYDRKGMWDEILQISDDLEVDELSTDENSYSRNGKNITIPADRKTWYQKKTKALEKLRRWDECLELTNTALNDFPNELWLKRRKAICTGKTGDINKAIEDLKRISIEKTDWFIFRDIAVLYGENQDYEKSLEYIIEACLVSVNLPDPGYRWELYYDAAVYLEKKGEKDMAIKHLEMAFSVREKEGWKIPQSLFELADDLNTELIYNPDQKAILNELKKYWNEEKFSNQEILTGTIKTILPNGKAGFISSADGKDYYFRLMHYNGDRKNINVGIKVKFNIQESFDKVKKKQSMQAVNVKEDN